MHTTRQYQVRTAQTALSASIERYERASTDARQNATQRSSYQRAVEHLRVADPTTHRYAGDPESTIVAVLYERQTIETDPMARRCISQVLGQIRQVRVQRLGLKGLAGERDSRMDTLNSAHFSDHMVGEIVELWCREHDEGADFAIGSIEELAGYVSRVLTDPQRDLTGAVQIAVERRRQIAVEGYTTEHDRKHDPHQLVDAALAYTVQGQDRLFAAAGLGVGSDGPDAYWPWDPESFRFDDDAIRSLTKAGALLAAAIDAAQAQPNH